MQHCAASLIFESQVDPLDSIGGCLKSANSPNCSALGRQTENNCVVSVRTWCSACIKPVATIARNTIEPVTRIK